MSEELDQQHCRRDQYQAWRRDNPAEACLDILPRKPSGPEQLGSNPQGKDIMEREGLQLFQNYRDVEPFHTSFRRSRKDMFHHKQKQNPPYKRRCCDKDTQNLVFDPCLNCPKDKGITFYSWYYGKPLGFPEEQGDCEMTEFVKKGAEKVENGSAEQFYFHQLSIMYYHVSRINLKNTFVKKLWGGVKKIFICDAWRIRLFWVKHPCRQARKDTGSSGN